LAICLPHVQRYGRIVTLLAIYWAAMPVSRVLVHRADGGFEEGIPLESISDCVEDRQKIVWLDIQDPIDADVELLRSELGFHELALEDTIRRDQRPKIDLYDGYCFVVFYAVRRGREDEIALFVGPNYLVTVHTGRVPEIDATVQRWQLNADRLGHGIAVVVYSLLDAIVDGYFPVIDEITEEVEEIETAMFESGNVVHQREVFALKRELLNLRRVIAPEREVLNTLIRRDDPILGGQTLPYFQDIYDHLIRITDSIDLVRDQLTSLLDAQLSVVSNRLNTVMKRMAALSTILMSVNLVAANYGMNFTVMPELGWPWGYGWALFLMVGIGVGLALVFKRIDWL
jgi:magnesium transporter